VFLLFQPLLLVLVILETLQSLKKRFSPLFIEDWAHGDKFSGIFPVIVARKNMKCIELQELDSSIEISWCVGAAGPLGRRSVPR
jgi:hypothetical protein